MTRFNIAVLTLLTAVGSAACQSLKIGVIHSELIVNSYPEFKKAEEQLAREAQQWEKDRAPWEADMERLKDEIMTRQEQLRAGENTFSDGRKAELQADIDSLQNDYDTRLQRQVNFEQERYARRRSELLQGVFEIVNKTIEELGEQNGYDLIIDTTNGTVVYARNPDDLNDQLLRMLQEK